MKKETGWLTAGGLMAVLSAPAGAVQIDGRLEPGEWQEARYVTDFRKVQPLNGEPATLATEAWVLATPEGLEACVRGFADETGRKLGKVAQPLRAALTGRSTSPGIFDVLEVLGRDEALARIGDQVRH